MGVRSHSNPLTDCLMQGIQIGFVFVWYICSIDDIPYFTV